MESASARGIRALQFRMLVKEMETLPHERRKQKPKYSSQEADQFPDDGIHAEQSIGKPQSALGNTQLPSACGGDGTIAFQRLQRTWKILLCLAGGACRVR